MSTTHRHGPGPEHDHEPQLGLPEPLPAREHLLWQGSPDWKALAVRAFHLRKLALYFALLLALRGAFVLHDGGSAWAAARAVLWLLPLAVIGIGLVTVLAWLSARATIYTLTDRRVVMRIGIVLTVTFNLPYKRLTAADLRRAPRGSADIALTLNRADRIGWLHLWPHVRPWQVARAQPMLRCVPRGDDVAALLTRAWAASTGQRVVTASAQAPALPPRDGRVPASPAAAALAAR